MANTKISALPTFTGDTTGVYLVMDNSGLTQTYKVTKETLIGVSGTSGSSGSSGTSGSSGSSGTSGSSGSSGTSGVGIVAYASGYVNAGAFVTLETIKATVTTGGQRGLSLATTTGSITAYLGATYGTASGGGGNASNGVITVNTTPSSSQFSYNFVGAADISTYILNDITNSRVYRITLMIGGGYLNNFISIERLY